MAPTPWTPVRRRYLVRTLAATMVYVAGVVGARYLISTVGVSQPVAVAVALVPGLAMAAMFINTISMIGATKDEFMRMLAVRQQLIAAGIALAGASVWGSLEMFGLAPHVDAFYIVVLWAVGLFAGQLANRVTHGVWGQCP
ncbi:MAG TPA: hypothetical protein VI168_08345 [Croceibacterium sp.]